MSSDVLISVIIPVSRSSDTLDRCLRSIFEAKYEKLEVILVGSVDRLRIRQDYETFVNMIGESRHSPSVRRNVGVDNSRGKFVCFLDDDVSVPRWYFVELEKALSGNPSALVGGANRETRQEFRFRYPAAIQANWMTEGLSSHREASSEKRRVGIHDLPLCNMAMTKQTFYSVGGFNESVSYYLDDVEFNYIALHTGRLLLSFKKLEVHHDSRPAFLPYFKYKWKTRYEIGRVFPLYSCLYMDSMQVKAVLSSYFLLPLLFFLGGWRLLGGLAACYFIVALAASWSNRKDYAVFCLLPPGIFLTHLMSYLGFTVGLIKGYLNFPGLLMLKQQKKERFKNVDKN